MTPSVVRSVLESFKAKGHLRFDYEAPCFVLHGWRHHVLYGGFHARWRLVPTSGIGAEGAWWIEDWDGDGKTEKAATKDDLARLIREWLALQDDGQKPTLPGWEAFAACSHTRDGDYYVWRLRKKPSEMKRFPRDKES